MAQIADIIKYEGDNSTFVWKHPCEDFNSMTQLIVHESQEAIFMMNGQALDLFGPGRYTLETQNMPKIGKFLKWTTGGETPFHCEVYFVNKTVQMGVKWGTDSRVRFIEPNTGIPLDIGASGELNLQVADARKLLVKLVGTTGGLTRGDILGADERGSSLPNENGAGGNMRNIAADRLNGGWAGALRGYFRPLIMTAVKTNLAATIKAQKINILEIDEQLETLSAALGDKIRIGFEEYGLTIPQFYITNVSLPEEDKNFRKVRDLLASSYLGVREAEVEAGIIAAQRQKVIEEQTTELERAKFEADKKRIAAQAEADAAKLKGFSEAEVMAAKGYNQRDVLQADVQKAYAEGIGNMGGNGGGGMMSDLLGLGVGMAAAGTMGAQVTNAMRGAMGGAAPEQSAQPTPAAENGIACPKCGAKLPSGTKFCNECGTRILPADEMICPHCGKSVKKGKFCPECGTRLAGVCPKCGAELPSGAKFCNECGEKL